MLFLGLLGFYVNIIDSCWSAALFIASNAENVPLLLG